MEAVIEVRDLKKTYKDGPSAVPEVIRILDEKGLHIDKLSLTRPSLDDVFLKVTGRKIRDDGPVQNWL